MLCIEIWSQDSTEHIEISTTWVSPMQVWTEEASTRIQISAELSQGIEVTCRNVSKEIEISATFTPEIEAWTSYVCSLYDGQQPAPYLLVIPDVVKFPCVGNIIRITQIFSNINWYIDETNKIKRK